MSGVQQDVVFSSFKIHIGVPLRPATGAMTRFLRLFIGSLLFAVVVSPIFAVEPGTSADHRAGADALAREFLPSTTKASASPDAVLDAFLQRSQEQRHQLSEYSDTTVIRADLPDTSQSGEYELRRRYVAPKTLEFKPVRFSGDNFVKTNVIIRVLQSEVDHVTKDEAAQMAIDEANYKFKHKYTVSDADGHVSYVYDVKPRKKRPGLFKGRIWVDAPSGVLRRVEGTLVKSPSFFIKRLEFVQEYEQVDGFVLPTHLHSESKVRVLGRAVVDIIHRDYTSAGPAATAQVAGTR
jgi:hypothetical protein